MNKYVYFDNRPVKLGDKDTVSDSKQVVAFTVTLETIPKLLKLGIIKEWVVNKADTTQKLRGAKVVTLPDSPTVAEQISNRMKQVNMNFTHYVNILADKMSSRGISRISANEALVALYSINKSGFFGLMLREIAIAFDESYTGHISTSKEMFVISARTGKPCQVTPDPTLYHSISLFRSNVDAIVASKILSTLKKEIFKSNGRRK